MNNLNAVLMIAACIVVGAVVGLVLGMWILGLSFNKDTGRWQR
jgi:hypothetical protein